MTNTITLDAGTGSSGPPSANLTTPGAKVVVGIVNVDDYQQRDFDSGDLLTWDDGKPKMGKVITGLVVSADNTLAGSDDEGTPAQPGDLVSFWCEGGRFYTYRDAVKEAGGINVGDVMLWTRLDDEPPKKKGFNPRKVYKATIRRPESKDGDLADRCVAAYHDIKSRPTLDTGAANTAGGNDFGDEEPFVMLADLADIEAHSNPQHRLIVRP